MSRRVLTSPQPNDPGSEGGSGYDYQWHVGARMALQMLLNKETEYLVCEFHEDTIQVNRSLGLKLVQIKKRDSGNWTMQSLIRPDKKQKQGILCKLFSPLAKGKDIKELLLTGYGKTSGDDELSLPGLIALLKYPQAARDDTWTDEIQKYVDFFCLELTPQGIDRHIILNAIRILDIDFSLPHPQVIEDKNKEFLEQFFREQLCVELTMPEIADMYQDLHTRIRKVSTRPGQPWTDKTLSRTETMNLLSHRARQYKPAGSRVHSLTTQDKLTSVGLGEKIFYAFEQRLDAMKLRFELGMTSAQWENYKTDINIEWSQFLAAHPGIQGPVLWGSLRNVLSLAAERWSATNKRLDSDFAEGVFFEMTGTCEAQWRNRI